MVDICLHLPQTTDPGIRNQIFAPMLRNTDGHYQLDTTFVTANHQIKCDATWSSKVFDNFKDYIDGMIYLPFLIYEVFQ